MTEDSAIRIDRCTAHDVPVIAALEPAGKDFARTTFSRQERGDCLYLVAWDGEVPIGSAELLAGDDPELRNVHVSTGARGRGIGTLLIRAAEDAVPRPGTLRIGVGLDNPAARRLYLRLGYTATGKQQTDAYEYVDDHGVRRSAVETSEWLEKHLPDSSGDSATR